MPIVTVDEDGYTVASEDDIRSSRKRFFVQAIASSPPPKLAPKSKVSFVIPPLDP